MLLSEQPGYPNQRRVRCLRQFERQRLPKPRLSEGDETIPRLPEGVLDVFYRRGMEPESGYLARYGWITPNRVSVAGFLAGGVGASVCVLILPLWTAGVLVLLGDVLDIGRHCCGCQLGGYPSISPRLAGKVTVRWCVRQPNSRPL